MSQPQRTVLIVDDSPEDCELYQRYLLRDREYQYTVVIADSARAGLELYQRQPPDLVLLDYQLPDLNGVEFITELQTLTNQPYLPVIVVTGVGNEAIAVEAIKAGAQNYLVKGRITPEQLLSAINNVIENLQLRTQLQQSIEKERLLARVTKQINKSQKLDEILQTTVSEVRQLLKTDRVVIFQIHSDFSGGVVAESVEPPWRSILGLDIFDPCLAQNYIERYRQGLINLDPTAVDEYIERYRQGLVTVRTDIYDGTVDTCHVELLARFQVWANMVVPILHDNYFWGILIAHHCRAPRQWQQSEIDLLQELGNYLSIALYRAESLQQIQNELTRRQRTEIELQESERQLQHALQAACMGTWDWNILTNQIQWSSNLEALFGLEPGEFDGSFTMFLSSVHPEDRDHVQEAINAAVTTGAEYNIEFRVVYPNGSIRWALSQGNIFYDELGQAVRMAGVDLDITERKRAEEELQLKAQILAQTHDSVISTDLDGYITSWNQGAERVFSYSAQEAVGQHIDLLYPQPEMRNVLQNQVIEPLKSKGEHEVQVRAQDKFGKIIDLLLSLSLLRDRNHNAVGMIGFSMDITDRIQVEEELRESEARYRYLAEAIPHLVWTCNAQGSRDYLNQKFYEYTGLPVEQALGSGWLLALHPEDMQRTQEIWETAVNNGTFYKCEHRLQRNSDGSYRWHLALGLPVKDEQGRVVKWFGTCTDIHDQKELEIERDRVLELEQVARNEAERANRIKDEFLAILSHELRSPLNPILGWTKLLQTRRLDDNKTSEALATIERNAKLQTQLIDDLLDIARILRGKLSLNADLVNLTFVIEAAIDTVRTAAVSKSILIHPVLPNVGEVSGDAVRLQQVFWNLLSNAIKFTPSGGRVDIRLERDGDQAKVTVTDNGKGISPDFLPHIFESFRQEDVSITRKYGGLGLGLAIVRHITEAHGGAVAVDSPGVGLGATFTVTLPLVNIESESNPSQELLVEELNLTGVKILTIDDEPDSRDFLRELLAYYGAEVMAVATSTEFLVAVESFQPDILVSDIGMPDVDGYTLLKQVRSLPPERGGQIPAIALTAYAGEINQQQALAAGFYSHLCKPIDPDLLIRTLTKLTK